MTYRHFNNETTRSSVLKAVADTENEAAWSRLFDLYAGFVFSMARVWCRLLLKAQCNIDLWMLECAKNNEYVPKLCEKIKQMRAIIKKQISFWEYSYIVGFTYLKRFVRKVIKKLF